MMENIFHNHLSSAILRTKNELKNKLKTKIASFWMLFFLKGEKYGNKILCINNQNV